MLHAFRSIPALALAAVLGACAGPNPRAPAAPVTPPAAAPPAALAAPAPDHYTPPCPTPPRDETERRDCDRRSILAMAGEFRVRFAFDETAALAPGYAPHDAQRSGGTELVLVIADEPTHVALQHILVLGPSHTVVKHWRQDWQYEPSSVLRFRGNGRFERETLPADAVRGAWSQTVYEVDDAPRYAGIGRWHHADGEDSWQSDRVWRPLPRREYTKRHDYQAIDAVNRHTLTPAGWVHEQDNTKLVLDRSGAAHALAREVGVNSYTRITDYDFGAGRDYWKKTAAYWAQLRAAWEREAAAHARFTTSPEPNGEPRIEAFFALAERAEKGESTAVGEIDALLARYVTP